MFSTHGRRYDRGFREPCRWSPARGQQEKNPKGKKGCAKCLEPGLTLGEPRPATGVFQRMQHLGHQSINVRALHFGRVPHWSISAGDFTQSWGHRKGLEEISIVLMQDMNGKAKENRSGRVKLAASLSPFALAEIASRGPPGPRWTYNQSFAWETLALTASDRWEFYSTSLNVGQATRVSAATGTMINDCTRPMIE